jgi:FixJ family two-component response regulator
MTLTSEKKLPQRHQNTQIVPSSLGVLVAIKRMYCVEETRLCIFVVDDDRSVTRALKDLLESAGFRVETFGSAEDFLSSGRSKDPGLLILDVYMPGMTGLELLEKLSASDSKMPVIFITAYDDSRIRQAILETGAVAFLQKPFDDHVLFEAVNLALDRIATVGIDAYPQSAEI